MTWAQAFDVWIENRILAPGAQASSVRYISERTLRDYRQQAKALQKFFGPLKLCDVHAGHLREYHRGRALCDPEIGAWAQPAGAHLIRKEIALLTRVMKSAGAWNAEIEREFVPLAPQHGDVRRAMSPAEQREFLRVAGSKPRWALIYCYAIVALQTTASTNELRALRLRDVDLYQGVIHIRRDNAKNKYRIRSIPIATEEARRALERLMVRGRQLGAAMPEHYLFPARICRNHFDPERPTSDSGLKKLWAEVRDAAGLPWLRPYDLRHTGLTRMAEAGTPVHVMMAYAGHMTMQMQQHYVSVSSSAMRDWARATWDGADVMRKPPQRAAAPRGVVRPSVVF